MPTESKFLNLCLTILVQWCISPIMKPCRACAWLTRLGHIRYKLLRNGSNCFFWTLNICSTKYMFLHTILFIHSVRTCLCKSVEIIYHYDIISIFIILQKFKKFHPMFYYLDECFVWIGISINWLMRPTHMKLMIWFHFRKDAEVVNLNSRLEDEQSLVAQLQRKIKELMVRTFAFFIFEMCFSLFHVAIKDCMCSNPGKCLDNCNSQNVHHRWTYFFYMKAI